MELRRNIYQKLIEWKKKDTGHVLELKGARQVGKTYILKKFGEENFKKMVYVNMIDDSGEAFVRCLAEVTAWKSEELKPQLPLRKALELFDLEFTDDKDTIVIIDEIQEFSEVYNQICTLARKVQCYVIVTGSYVGRLKEPEVFMPADDIEQMTMDTLSFGEFLDVFGAQELYETLELQGKDRIEDYQRLKEYYDIYQKIGGYPAVVVCYAKFKDLKRCYAEIGKLINLFADESRRNFRDIVTGSIFQKLLYAIALNMIREKQGVCDLTKELCNIIYPREEEYDNYNMIKSIVCWLQESFIIEYACKSNHCDYMQMGDIEKYYFLDMGIAHYFLRMTGTPFDMIRELLDENFVYLSQRHRPEKCYIKGCTV